MADRERKSRMTRFAVVALSLTMLPACQGAGLFQRRQALRPVPGPVEQVVPHSAYRPVYSPGPPKRTLFLGGYAGYNYAPRRTRVEGYVPTKFGYETWGVPDGRSAKGLGIWHR